MASSDDPRSNLGSSFPSSANFEVPSLASSSTVKSDDLEDVLLPLSSSPSRLETPDDAAYVPSSRATPISGPLIDFTDEPLLDVSASSWLSFSETKPSVYSGEIKPPMMGAGLENLGNTCFLNAILQCFTHTVPLVQSLRSWNHANQCHRDSKGFCVLCTLRDHIELSLASSGRVISPSNLVENLSNISSSFMRYQQEDAHEFLQCLLDRLDTCCLDPNPPTQSLSLQNNGIVKQIFGGQLRSQLCCCNCGHCSDTFEPLIDLSLEIEDADSLACALQSFTKVEKIDPETRFTCENCKQQVSVEKQLTLYQAPSVAAFHLKRFKSDGSNVEKIDKHVSYPLELDLQQYTSSSDHENNVEVKYELYAVVVHDGISPWSGHYFCYIRSSPGTWYSLDDSKVIGVREAFVLSQNAYILFYARQGLPWFSTLMETQTKCVATSSDATSPKSVLEDVGRTFAAFPLQANTSRVEDTGRIYSGWSMTVDDSENFDQVDESGNADQVDAQIYARGPVNSFPTEASNFNDKVDKHTSDAQRLDITSLKASNYNHKVHGSRRDVIVPQTPPRSPSPDIYSEEPAELIYSIPRDHLKIKNAAKETPESKALNDLKKKEACRLTRSMPSSRRSQLVKAVLGPRSEGSSNKKRRQRVKNQYGGASSSNAFRELGSRSLMSTLTSGGLY